MLDYERGMEKKIYCTITVRMFTSSIIAESRLVCVDITIERERLLYHTGSVAVQSKFA